MIDIYSLALTQVHGIGPAIAKKLMEVYPSAEAFFNESHSNLTELFGKQVTKYIEQDSVGDYIHYVVTTDGKLITEGRTGVTTYTKK